MYFLGLDIGSTVLKAAVFDLEGNELGIYGELAETYTPKPGYYERDLDELWAANIRRDQGRDQECRYQMEKRL